jgi:hypothetical protein
LVAQSSTRASKAAVQASTPCVKLAQFVSVVDFGYVHNMFHHDFKPEYRLLDDVDNLKVVGKRGGASTEGLGTGLADLSGIDPGDGADFGGGGAPWV